jgi:tRNA pseudouridine13 synthase
VDEIPLYAASGEGPHLYVRVRKRSLTTAQLLKQLARASRVPERDIGYAGIKDKHAVTTQWFSFPNSTEEQARSWQLPDGVEVLECSRHQNKLRTGHQAGNRFRIELVDVARPTEAVLEPLVRVLTEQGLGNYYGKQRFGQKGESLSQAVAWASGRLRVRDRFLAKFLPSVIQAEVFNRYLLARRALDLTNLLEGEVVRLANSSKMFVVEDPNAERPRLQERDLFQTGPIVGPKMKPAKAAALALEQAALAELGLDPAQLERLFSHAPGSRRDLLVFPQELSYELLEAGRVRLSFSLPSGAYATEVLAQFTQDVNPRSEQTA